VLHVLQLLLGAAVVTWTVAVMVLVSVVVAMVVVMVLVSVVVAMVVVIGPGPPTH